MVMRSDQDRHGHSRDEGRSDDAASESLAWVAEIRRGHEVEANSRRLFKRFYPWVAGFFVRRHCGHERAEELAQDTFLQVFDRLPSFRAEGTFESWLFAIAANQFRHEQRRLSQAKRNAPEVPIEKAQPIDDALQPEERAYRRERLEALAGALEHLPDKPRDCLRLRLAGHDYNEIGELLQIAPSTVRVHVFTARKQLRERFGDALGAWIT